MKNTNGIPSLKEEKYRIPSLKNLNHSTLETSSPSQSFYQNNSSYILNSKPRVPKLKNRQLPLSRGICYKNPIDQEFYEEYKRWELKRSQKIQDDKFPFWFIHNYNALDLSSSKSDSTIEALRQPERGGFISWCDDLIDKSNNI